MATPREIVGERLRRLRGNRSQKLVADRIASIGHSLDRSAIARIENSERGVSVDDLLFLAAALRVSPIDLLVSEERTLDLGNLPLVPQTARDWLTGAQPEAVLQAEVRREAEAFASQQQQGDEWADRLSQEVLGDPDLSEQFELGLAEASKRRAFLMHILFASAAYRMGGDEPG